MELTKEQINQLKMIYIAAYGICKDYEQFLIVRNNKGIVALNMNIKSLKAMVDKVDFIKFDELIIDAS